MTTAVEQPAVGRYVPADVERKWQERWASDGTYAVREDDPRPKWYELTMYPYPSGDLHIGHWYTLAPSDAHARFKRMQGFNVLHPMGFDAFGLPAENAAIKDGVHPQVRTMQNIERMRKQLRSMGPVYDWSREIVTCAPEYYKWNQWLFLKFYEAGLAYRAFAPANWCPNDNTVLANEQVKEGRCERCGTEVARRDIYQWLFRVTKYADELLDQSQIDWPEKIKTMQTNWIGRSEGVDIEFDISEYGLDQQSITTFTTRIDTIFGVTFVVLAPEHPLVDRLTTPERRAEVEAYVNQARKQSEIERLSTEKAKTGVHTGAYAVNRLNGERVPILVGDYVLMSYGTGIVMGVPAHDQRDFEFAQKYGLPIKVVISPPGYDGAALTEAYMDEGTQINSLQFDGLPSAEGWRRIADYIEDMGWGRRIVRYRMRDWLISRQRYWGTPIPIVYCDGCGTVPAAEDQLPVLLPDDAEFRPTGESPLGLHAGFSNTTCPACGGAATRETDTMDTFVDSSWYQFRFTDPTYSMGPFEKDALRQWGPVDQYTGGAEHAVMHLLYARFFTKAMRDLELLDFDEPFIRLYNQGHILAADDGLKMSKSQGNVVSPDEYVVSYGADAVRCYLMFIGPWDRGGRWKDSGINGVSRWLNRVWEIAQRDTRTLDAHAADATVVSDLTRAMHKTIRKVENDVERFKFNTAIAGLMEFTNTLSSVWERGVDSRTWNDAVEHLLLLLAPMAPHITEELWARAGHTTSIHNEPLPEYDPALAADETIELVVQVNGRVRAKIDVPADVTQEDAMDAAMSAENVLRYTEGKEITKTVYVPGRLVSILVK